MWDFGHRPPKEAYQPENNQQTDMLVSKGRFKLDEDAREIYIINCEARSRLRHGHGAFKRGWGGHGMPLSEITNDPIPPYTWTGGAAAGGEELRPRSALRRDRRRTGWSISASAARTGSRCSRSKASG